MDDRGHRVDPKSLSTIDLQQINIFSSLPS